MGVMGATIIRGDIGGEVGGVVVEDIEEFDEKEAERGLWESLRRQLGRGSVSSGSRKGNEDGKTKGGPGAPVGI